ncbi:hypothetical protein CLV63_1113 [Murinocardiopsis flavida]|uniref:Uncharacterized protein n=1 Tax=Murinocardiopsis flavida TaxID=645275 RepID=A0A2P8DGU6_9ACTN|nr:hypothetical protein [Murinocardiopsis flavida]PSK96409.1 hypothetical protein CLV63_1113 [Murinocardiopsis flavida]
MNALVNVLLFGIAGSTVMAALIGLLMVFGRGASASWPRVAFGVLTVLLLLTAPVLAAAATYAADSGFTTAFSVAFAVVILICATTATLTPALARRTAPVTAGRAPLLRPTPASFIAVVAVCGALGLFGAGVGTVLV